MATIAEMLVASQLEANQKPLGVAENFRAGAELGLQIEKAQQQRAALEQKKAEVDTKKDDYLFKMFAAGMKMKEKEQKLFFAEKGPFRNARDGIGKTEQYPDDKLNWITATPENISKAYGVLQDAREGKIDRETALATIYDESKYPELTPYQQQQFTEDINKASDAYIKGREAAERARLAQEAALGKQVQAQEAAPKVEQGKKIAAIAANYNTLGKSGVQNVIDKYEKAIGDLEKGVVKTGGVKGLAKAAAGKFGLQGVVDPKLKALIDDVRGAINLRESLADPNPTQKQIDQTLSRIIDETLPMEQNIAKLKAYLKETKLKVQNQQNEFIKRGLMDPKDAWVPRARSFSDLSPAAQAIAIKKFAAQNNITEEEARKRLGGE